MKRFFEDLKERWPVVLLAILFGAVYVIINC